MKPGTRRILATINLASIALGVPAILYHHIFQRDSTQGSGSRTLLLGVLIFTWLALALRPLATPSGRPWPFWKRAVVLVGGHLSMALLMWRVHAG